MRHSVYGGVFGGFFFFNVYIDVGNMTIISLKQELHIYIHVWRERQRETDRQTYTHT